MILNDEMNLISYEGGNLMYVFNKITVTPNPANVYVAFNYELPLLEDNAVIYINIIFIAMFFIKLFKYFYIFRL